MRSFVGALVLAAAVMVLAADPAWASCLPPVPADQIARAEVIAFGRVTSVDRAAGTVTFQPRSVYKGDPGGQPISVQIGPGPRSPGGATSVDYRADPGDHVLYLRRQGTAFATDDCSGSHPGPATGDELRLLSGGRIITYEQAPDPLQLSALPVLLALAAAAAVTFLAAWRRPHAG